ncbi:MAG: hypothetical protein OJF58_004233 [Enhydrobacter sp.]|nr:MAG: hypothetical protein OJF58_004233 [Enhydrobacter sp.]
MKVGVSQVFCSLCETQCRGMQIGVPDFAGPVPAFREFSNTAAVGIERDN